MAATVSLSKGVFAFRKGKNLSGDRSKSAASFDFWRQEEGRDDPHIQECTLKNYKNCWRTTSLIIEKLLSETHAKVLQELVDYIKNTGTSRCQSLLNDFTSFDKDIPAACLVTGVNIPDHETIFDHLIKALKEKVSPHIARLDSHHCSNVKFAIFKIINSLVNEGAEDLFESLSDDDDDDEIFFKQAPQKKIIKKGKCTMACLSSWYKETEMERKVVDDFLTSPIKKSPKKKIKICKDHLKCEESESRPIIVVIEEVELVPPRVLQDLILIISDYQRKLPMVLVFGVSTSPSYIHEHLRQDASSGIALEVFQAQPSNALLSNVINQVLVNSFIPFRLGPKVLKLLLDIFLFHDLAVNNFISGLKFCMLEHFLRGQASFLCCKKKEREELLLQLNEAEVAALRGLASYKKLEESLPASEREKLEDDSYFCKNVSVYLRELESWYSTFCALVKILHCLIHSLPGSPLGRQVREVLATCLGQQVTDLEEFQSAWKLLSMIGKQELAPRLEEAIKILEESEKTAELVSLFESLVSYSDRLMCVGAQSHQDHSKEQNSPFVVDLKPSDRFYLKEKLLGIGKVKPAKNPFEVLREEILTCFEHVFISYLKPVHLKPFHEVFFFDSIGSVKYQLLGSIRATVTTGLLNPYKYLQCKCCKMDDSDNLLSSLPDLSICYKLHLECGRYINLYDWMQAFIAVVGEEDSKKKSKKKEVDAKLQARFIQCVSELQLLGFIKPTKRKTDHVERLTWGGC